MVVMRVIKPVLPTEALGLRTPLESGVHRLYGR
jgi:hypothetical protein